MKKIIVVLAAALIGFSANAQFYVGGSLGFDNDSPKNGDATTTFSITPEIGYSISDKLAVGAYLGINTVSGDMGRFTWQINPYVRYTFAQVGSFSIFADGGLNLYGYKYKNANASGFNWGLFVAPGCAYSLTDKWSLVAHFCSLYFNSSSYDGNQTGTSFGLELTNTISSFGFYYNF